MMLLLGFAALAVDIGAGFNERRQDQSAADAGVMAGAVDGLLNSNAMRDQALDYVRRNLDTTYPNAEWQALWEGCTDPSKNDGGFSFTPVRSPWTVGTDLDCINTDPAGFLRVKVPTQLVDTTFGKVLGADNLSTSAAAISRLGPSGGAGILPFGLLSTATSGEFVCLRDNSAGQAKPPCDGPNTGNFGAIESPWIGTNPDLPTFGSPNCNGSPKKNVLALNIAEGLDHTIVIDADGIGGNEVRDQCSAPPDFPDTLNTFQGLGQGTEQGLVSGVVPFGVDPRLQRSPAAWESSIFDWNLDNKPLWDFIDTNLDPDPPTSSPIPASCDPDSFDNALPQKDWDGDGTMDDAESWEHMLSCLADYASGLYSATLFTEQLGDSSRYALVPQFWENTWPPGNSEWRHVMAFRPVFIQTLWFGTGNDSKIRIFNPAEPCIKADDSSCSYSDKKPGALRQLAAFLLPDSTLPELLQGSAPGGTVNPYHPELYR